MKSSKFKLIIVFYNIVLSILFLAYWQKSKLEQAKYAYMKAQLFDQTNKQLMDLRPLQEIEEELSLETLKIKNQLERQEKEQPKKVEEPESKIVYLPCTTTTTQKISTTTQPSKLKEFIKGAAIQSARPKSSTTTSTTTTTKVDPTAQSTAKIKITTTENKIKISSTTPSQSPPIISKEQKLTEKQNESRQEPRDSCEAMLTTGKWENFQFKNHNSLSTNGEWNYSGDFVPSYPCQIHHYNASELQTCLLLKNKEKWNLNPTIQIIGDSRARVLYRTLSARLHGQDSIEDVKVHDDLANAPFMYYWSQSFNGKPIENYAGKPNNSRHEMTSFPRLLKEGAFGVKRAQLVVISEHFLHPSTDLLEDPVNRKDYNLVKNYFEEMFQFFEEKILTRISSFPATIIFMASEGSKKRYNGWSQKNWDDLQKFYNDRLYNMIEKTNIKNSSRAFNKRLFYMTINQFTGYGPNKENLLPDMTHKMTKGEIQKIPPSLMADTDVIFNLHCNRKMGKNLLQLDGQEICCSAASMLKSDQHEL